MSERSGYQGYPLGGGVQKVPNASGAGGGGVPVGGPLIVAVEGAVNLVNSAVETTIGVMPQVGIMAVSRAMCRVTIKGTYSTVGAAALTFRLKAFPSNLVLARAPMVLALAAAEQLSVQFGFMRRVDTAFTQSIGGYILTTVLGSVAQQPEGISTNTFAPGTENLILTAEWGVADPLNDFIPNSMLFEVMYGAS